MLRSKIVAVFGGAPQEKIKCMLGDGFQDIFVNQNSYFSIAIANWELDKNAQARSSVKIAFHVSGTWRLQISESTLRLHRTIADFNNAAAQPCTLKTVATQSPLPGPAAPSPFSTEDMIARMCATACSRWGRAIYLLLLCFPGPFVTAHQEP